MQLSTIFLSTIFMEKVQYTDFWKRLPIVLRAPPLEEQIAKNKMIHLKHNAGPDCIVVHGVFSLVISKNVGQLSFAAQVWFALKANTVGPG